MAIALDILELEKALSSVVAARLGRDSLAVEVVRYPQLPLVGQGQGDSGRPAVVYVGFNSVSVSEVEETEDSPVQRDRASLPRDYELTFFLALETYGYVDPDDALRIIQSLLSLNGYLMDVADSRPLMVSLEFTSHEGGYWTYAGSIIFRAIAATDIELAIGEVISTPVKRLIAGVYAGPPGALTPRRDGDKFVKDADLIADIGAD